MNLQRPFSGKVAAAVAVLELLTAAVIGVVLGIAGVPTVYVVLAVVFVLLFEGPVLYRALYDRFGE